MCYCRNAGGAMRRLAVGKNRLVTLLAMLAMVAASCNRGSKYGRGLEFQSVAPPDENAPSDPIESVAAYPPYSPFDTYLLRAGDELQFTLSVDPRPRQGAYRLNVNDLLTVEYLHDPSADRRGRQMK